QAGRPRRPDPGADRRHPGHDPGRTRGGAGGDGGRGHPVGGRRQARADGEKKVQRAAEQDRPDVRRKRDEWKAARPALDPDRLVFVDETWASTNMARRYGRSPKGQRLVCPVPHGHWKTTTFVAALRADGLTAPVVV